MIPNQIAWETHNVVPSYILEGILEKLADVFGGEKKAVSEKGKFKFYMKAEELPFLKLMKDLGLAVKKPAQKNNRSRELSKPMEDVYELTQKAWRWYALSLALRGM